MKNKDFTLEDKFELGFESPDGNAYAHKVQENIELEVEPSQVSLKSFRKQKHLADHLWHGDELDLAARLRLMDIAEDFWAFCKINWVEPLGVILTGSICNYNWSEFSDIDLHLIVDFGKVHKKTDFVKEYFDEKKNAWNNEHSSLKIYDFPVELYVQDIDDEVESGGIYDLWQNKWIKEPSESQLKPIELNKYSIKKLAAHFMTEIDDLCDAFETETDKHKIEQIGDKCESLLHKISNTRKQGLKDGEMGTGNIVYKCLRRTSYLDKLWGLISKIYDKTNSIEESLIFNKRIKEIFL